jgi:microcystin-dependent protein
MGGTDAGRLSVSNTLGGSGGAETHTLTTSEMPAHTHAATASGGNFLTDTAGTGANVSTGGGGYALNAPRSTGGGGAHNNMQPYMLMNYIIKT